MKSFQRKNEAEFSLEAISIVLPRPRLPVSHSGEPGPARWYVRWRLSAVCWCRRLPSRLLTCVSAAVSLCEPAAGETHNKAVTTTCHTPREAAAQAQSATF